MLVLIVVNDYIGTSGIIGAEIIDRGGYYDSINPHTGYQLTPHRSARALPLDHHDYDALVVLGGVMDAFDDTGFPKLRAVMQLMQNFYFAQKPILGVCLGAQLLARAFGKAVYRHVAPEIGFTEMSMTEEGRRDPLLAGLARTQHIMQWHNDTFDLPEEAVLLMTSETCRHQAFRVGRFAYGFQCHFEVTVDMIRDWLRGGATYFASHGIDLPLRIEQQMRAYIHDASSFGRTITQHWLDLIAASRVNMEVIATA